MKFVKFKNVKNIQDGDNFLVVYPNGVVVLCWYSRRGYFSPVENYDLLTDSSEETIENLDSHRELLVIKVTVEDV